VSDPYFPELKPPPVPEVQHTTTVTVKDNAELQPLKPLPPPEPLGPNTTTVTVQGGTSSVITTVPFRDNSTPFLQFVGHVASLTALAGVLRIPESVMHYLGVFTANADLIQSAVVAVAILIGAVSPSITGAGWYKQIKRVFTGAATRLFSVIGMASVLIVILCGVCGCTSTGTTGSQNPNRFLPHTHGNASVCTDSEGGSSGTAMFGAMVGGERIRVKPVIRRPVNCTGGVCE